ncbi:MAG: hypothetical protein QOG10_1144, partial [Kribbellaceae bacterium]|nr:hypothetical protein [Kribbellaceae bacterium]
MGAADRPARPAARGLGSVIKTRAPIALSSSSRTATGWPVDRTWRSAEDDEPRPDVGGFPRGHEQVLAEVAMQYRPLPGRACCCLARQC